MATSERMGDGVLGFSNEIRRIASRVMSPSIRRELEQIADGAEQKGMLSEALAELAGIRNAIGANAEAQAHYERAAASFVSKLLDSGETHKPRPYPGPATGPYVERLARIFRDHPNDDTSALVLIDFANASIAAATGGQP